jgi:hypothetical protein
LKSWNEWSHDGTEDGIYDLAGSVWRWVSGLRVLDGEVQIIPDNDAALNPDMGVNDNAWQGTGYGLWIRDG